MSNTTNTTKYGLGSLENNLGNDNTGIGAYAAYNNLDASNNTAIGSNSAFFNTTGSNNTSLGAGSICNNTTGALNTAIGSSALEGIVGSSVGNENTAVGAQSLYTNQGSLNTAIGTYSALGVIGGNYNTFLGANTSTLSDINCDYSTAIGYNAKVDASNQIMMGGNNSPFGYPNVIIPGKAYLPNFVSAGAVGSQLVTKQYVDDLIGGLTGSTGSGPAIYPGQGLNETIISGSNYLNVDTSLNFINFLDSTSGVTGANGSLVLGGYSTNTIIGPTGGNPVKFQSQIEAQMGITGPTGSFTILNTPTITNTTTTTPYRITATDRLYQELGPGPSYNAVNGYYGLAKDAYPALNPYSSGVKAVSTWTARTTNTNSWENICWSPELAIFVAVASSGTGNRVMTSPNGIDWTTRTSVSDSTWAGVVWSRELGLFVAVAYGGPNRIMTSTNGINWTPQTAPNGNQYIHVTWSPELGLFVAVSNGPSSSTQKVMYSNNGSNWNSANTNTNNWYDVTWSPELKLFVAVSANGNLNRVMTSTNGINWTDGVTPSPEYAWRSIIWSRELGIFVVVGDAGGIMTSPDGFNWTNRSSPANYNWRGVSWSPQLEVFVAVSTTGGTDRVMYSPNGINWFLYNASSNNNWNWITWAPELGIFAAVSTSTSTNNVMTSSLAGRPPTSYNVFDNSFNRIDQNGNWTFGKRVYQQLGPNPSYNTVNNYYGLAKDAYPALNPYSSGAKAVSVWNPINIPDTIINNNLRSVCWAPEIGLFAAISNLNTLGGGSQFIVTSPDGINWTPRTTPNAGWRGLCWSSTLRLFCAVARTGPASTRSMTSSDGITWVLGNLPGGIGAWFSVVWSPELGIFCVSDLSGLNMATSPDGVDWTVIPNAVFVSGVIAIAWSPELSLFVSVAPGGGTFPSTICTSPDGVNWTLRATGLPAGIQSIAWSPELGLFCVVTPNAPFIYTSPDGITWTSRTPPVNNQWTGVCWAAEVGLFVACATGGTINRIMYSPDGINWTARSSAVDNQWGFICWAAELGIFCAVSILGTTQRALISSLTGRPPTSYNVFDNSFNRIDQNGNWTFGKRVYQELGPDPSYNAVNNYYGLAKDAYPALNPSSSGVKAVELWNKRNTNDNNWSYICWSPQLKLFAAVSTTVSGVGSNNAVMTSPDGINWNTQISVPNNIGYRCITWAPELGLFCAVSNTGQVMTSPNGINWTQQTNGVPSSTWHGVVWAPELGLFCAVARTQAIGGNRNVMISSDGINWTGQNISGNNIDYFSVAWAPELGLFCAVSLGGFIATSSDGVNWNSASGFITNLVSICWSSELGIFVAISQSSSQILRSSNGINWRSTDTGVSGYINVCWAPELGLFIVVGNDRLITSPDGINWTLRTPAASYSWFSVCWSPELGISAAVATSGTGDRAMTSSLAGRPPTSYNVFDSSFNSIDPSGNWTFNNNTYLATTANTRVGIGKTNPTTTLDVSGNAAISTSITSPLLENTSGNIEIKCNTTGVGGTISLTGGTGLIAGSAGASTGTYLALTINGTPYKIALLSDV